MMHSEDLEGSLLSDKNDDFTDIAGYTATLTS